MEEVRGGGREGGRERGREEVREGGRERGRERMEGLTCSGVPPTVKLLTAQAASF